MSRRSQLRVQDILDAIDRIHSYVAGMDYEHFLADRKTQDAVTRNIEIIGEAARALPEDFQERHADVPWSEIVAMRNVIVHNTLGYFRKSSGTSSRTNCRRSGHRSPDSDPLAPLYIEE